MRNLGLLTALWLVCLTVQAQHERGDIIEVDGQKAIVYWVDDTGQHGKAMSVKGLRGVDDAWCKNKKVAERLPDLSDERDGLKNTQTIIGFAAEQGVSLADFPAFEWCQKLGPSWYIPSVKELEGFVNYWLGNEQEMDWDADDESEQALDDGRPYYKQVNERLLDAGGIPFLNGVFTSTVNADGKVYVFTFNRAKNTWSFHKRDRLRVGKSMVARAFCNF